MNKNGKANLLVIGLIVLVALVVFGVIKLPQGSTSSQPTGSDGQPVNANPNYQPTASYATFDKFSTTSVGGTSYYIKDSQPFTTTAYANVVPGKTYTYWVLNSTDRYVKPVDYLAESGVNDIVNKESYQNGSVTFTTYNNVDKCLSDGLTCNMSMGANKQGNMEFTYIGGAKTANLPFGGVLVLEYNNTLTSVSCSGDGIVGLNSKHQVTYGVAAITNTYQVYEVASGFDISTNSGLSGITRKFTCVFNNGATAVAANQAFYAKFIPANYYAGNDGKIYLDVEQKKNAATTRTGFTNGQLTNTFYTEA